MARSAAFNIHKANIYPGGYSFLEASISKLGWYPNWVQAGLRMNCENRPESIYIGGIPIFEWWANQELNLEPADFPLACSFITLHLHFLVVVIRCGNSLATQLRVAD